MSRPPKPTALRLVQGNPSGRPINTEEPVPPRANLDPPKTLISVIAIDTWNELAPLLADIGVFTETDRRSLENYCHAWSRLKRIEDREREDGIDLTRSWDLAQKSVRAWGSELGLSPASRSRIRANVTPGIGKKATAKRLLKGS